jgi:NifU-like protein involved in Fe-S cluster formation
MASVEKRSPICGSHIVVDIDLDGEGRVTRFGQTVSACALGQASASLLGAHVVGQSRAELARHRRHLADYLNGLREDPGDWPGLSLFAEARRFRARHAAILLPFDAAAEAAALAWAEGAKP